jgi:RNA processing factor Prp31
MSWKQVMRARFIHVEDPQGYIRKMSIKTVDLDKTFYGKNESIDDYKENRAINMYETVLNEIANKYGFKPITIDGVYSDVTNTFHEDIKVYSILYTLHLYSYIQEKMREVAKNIYPLYKAGEQEDFHDACFEATRYLNQGKLTKKQQTKTHSISRSLDMLSNLDEDYCQYLVNRFLAKDEFVDLDETTRMITL